MYFCRVVSDRPLAVNFIKLRKHNKLRIPFKFVNAEHSVDMAKGSYLIKVNRYLDCICDGVVVDGNITSINENIPAEIEVNLANCKTGDIIRLNTKHKGENIVKIPDCVHINKKSVKPDLLLGVVRAGK